MDGSQDGSRGAVVLARTSCIAEVCLGRVAEQVAQVSYADGVDSGSLLPDDERIPHVTLSIDGLGGPAQIEEVGGR